MKPLLKTILLAVLLPTASQADDRQGGHHSGRDGDKNGHGLKVIGLTSDQRLVVFTEHRPERTFNIGAISGLIGGDTALIGIDYRVQDEMLYGVGNAGGVYLLNTGNAAATFVNRLSVALTGTTFGVDFNPAADRLRIVGDDGQNLRHNINAGGITLVDGVLNYTAGTPALGVTGAAYTNNDLDATTGTTLYDIDTALDQVVIQSPPNNGSLAATGKLTVDSTASVGFDIYSTVRNGATVEVDALASLTASNGFISLYSISLPTGKATLRGTFKAWDKVVDIAIPLNQL
ncbi:MAG: DUF4394 domain-containing protein [Verrucomicrobiota bacterium]